MDRPNQNNSSPQDEAQRGASGVTRSASATQNARDRSPSRDSALSRSGTPSDTQSSNGATIIHNHHYYCCNQHHGPNVQGVPTIPAAPSADAAAGPAPQPPLSPQQPTRAPTEGFDVYQQAPQPPQPDRSRSSRLDNLERNLDRVQRHLSSAFYRIAETRVENRRLRRILDRSIVRQGRRPNRSPQRDPHLLVAPRPDILPPRPLRSSPRRANNPSPQYRNVSPPHFSPSAAVRHGVASPAHHSPAVPYCRCANCAPRNRQPARRSPPLPEYTIPQGLSPFFRGYAEGGIRRRSASSPNVSPRRRGLSQWEPIRVLSPIRSEGDSPADAYRRTRFRISRIPQGLEASPAIRNAQLNENATTTSAQAVQDSDSVSESVPSLEEPPQSPPSRSQSLTQSPQLPIRPDSPPTHPHSPNGDRVGDHAAVSPDSVVPAPALFTRPHSDAPDLPPAASASASVHAPRSVLAIPAPTLSENIAITQRQLRAFFLDEIRLVRETNSSATPQQLWGHFVDDIVESGIFLTATEIRASWHFAFGQPSSQIFNVFCTMNMGSLLARLAHEADHQ